MIKYTIAVISAVVVVVVAGILTALYVAEVGRFESPKPTPTVRAPYQAPAPLPVPSACNKAWSRFSNSDTTYEALAAWDDAVNLSCRWPGFVPYMNPHLDGQAPPIEQGYDAGSDTPIADEWQQRIADDEAQRKADWEKQQAEWDQEQTEWDADMCRKHKEDGYC